MTKLLPLLAIAAAALFGGALWFLQTAAGFQSAIRPLAARYGVEIEAEFGRVSWFGDLELENATVRSGDAIEVALEQLTLDLRVSSLLPGRRLELESLAARALDVRLTPGEEGGPPSPLLPILPVVRPDLSIEDLRVEWKGEGESLVVGPVSAHFRCEPDGCPIAAEIPFRRANGEGRFELAGRADAVAAGGWSWNARAELRDESQAALRVVVDLVGSADDRALELAAPWTLSGAAGDARGTVQGRLESMTRRSHVEIALESARPVLERMPPRLRSVLGESVLRGDVQIDVAHERLTAKSELLGESLVFDGDGPRALHITGDATVGSGVPLELGSLVLELRGDDEAGYGKIECAGRLRDDAGIALQIQDLALAPWLMAIGASVPESDRALVLGGDVTFRRPEEALLARAALALVGGAAGEVRMKAEAGGSAQHWSIEGSLDGPGAAEARVEATRRAEAGIAAEIRVADWDLTPWAYLWERAEADTAEPASESLAAETSTALPDLHARIEAERLRLDEIEVRRAELTVDREGEATLLTLAPSELLGGTAEWHQETRRHGGEPTLEWDGRGEDLSLGALWPSLGVGTGLLSGRLSFETSGRGVGPEPLDVADGSFAFTLDDGAAEGTGLQAQVVSALDMSEYSVLAVRHADGEWEIVDGTAYVDELRIGSDVLHLMLTGEITRTGMALRANPRLSPSLAARVEGQLSSALLGTVDGALALPIVATVEGPWGDLRTGVLPAAPATLETLFDGLTTMAGAAGEATGLMPAEGP